MHSSRRLTKFAGRHGGVPMKEQIRNQAEQIFHRELVDLISHLHRRFEPQRQELLSARRKRQSLYDRGEVPRYPDNSSFAARGEWRIAPLPADLLCRRVEITGPVNSAKMVINMLNRGADGARADMAMLDFEDSMKPTWPNVLDGYQNVIAACEGSLEFTQETLDGGKTYKMDPEDHAGIMVRVRGLHLSESNFAVDGTPVSGGLLDLATCFFHTARSLLAQSKTPKYYVPKCEHFLEARWWSALFKELEKTLGFATPTLRATFLIETLPAAYQIEEILYEIREHAAGLNVGRWDKIFSDIKVLKNHPDRVLADRAEITMKKPWMDDYAKRLIKICHARGAMAIGGMSAFTPGKDPDLREKQTQKVFEDKSREFSIGHDGCWVSHPYFIGYALRAFPERNQLSRQLDSFDKYPDLLPQGGGPRTLQGLRTNIRVGIAYLQGWNDGIGCVAWDNLMEDLATLEISRAQTWQWLKHEVTLDTGERVSSELVKRIFDEELSSILAETADRLLAAKFQRAKEDAERIFLQTELPDFLSLQSEKE